jgi:alpha-methylacyl-CoA racemase
MVDGSAMLMSVFVGLSAMGFWSDDRGTNMLDGGAHFYGVYQTADGGWISIASYEPQFYAELARLLGPLGIALDPAAQMDRSTWSGLKERMAALFRTRTRDEWVEFFAGHEVCFAPVLTMSEARAHPHNVARQTFIEIDGAPQPAPAPRFSRSEVAIPRAPVVPGADTDTALADWGLAPDEVATLKASGALA